MTELIQNFSTIAFFIVRAHVPMSVYWFPFLWGGGGEEVREDLSLLKLMQEHAIEHRRM